jgi:hypothetical protein
MRPLGNRPVLRLLSLSLLVALLGQAGCLSKTPSFEVNQTPRDYNQAAENHPDHPFRTDVEEKTERQAKEADHQH